MKVFRKEFQIFISILLGVLSSIIANVFFTIPFIYTLFILLIITTIFLLVFTIWIKPLNIFDLGIKSINVKEKFKINTSTICQNVSTSFLFFGICAFRTVRDNSFRELIEKNRMKKDIIFKFLLLKPDSSALTKRANEEDEDPESIRHEVDATLTRLAKYKAEFDLNLEVRLYDSVPLWRMIFIDDSLLLLNQFLSGAKGTTTPQIIIEKDHKYSLFTSFKKSFDYYWSISKQVI